LISCWVVDDVVSGEGLKMFWEADLGLISFTCAAQRLREEGLQLSATLIARALAHPFAQGSLEV